MRVCTLFHVIVTCLISLTRAEDGADIVFILDGSGSVSQSNFANYLLQFVKDVSNSIQLGSQSNYRVGIVQFANEGVTELDLTDDIVHLEQRTREIEYLDQNTNTTGGILEALQVFERSTQANDRTQIGILLTDGRCSRDCTGLSAAAELARHSGITMLSIGIGDDVIPEELNTIATTQSDDVFTVNEFRLLLQRSFLLNIITRIHTITASMDIGDTSMEQTEGSGADVVFILDSSESVTESSYQSYVLPFVYDVITRLPLGDTMYQAAIISYGSAANLYARLRNDNDVSSVSNLVNTVPFRSGQTNTSDALWAFRTTVTSPTWRDGSREHLPTIGVLITDGRSTVDSHLTVPEAMRIHDAGLSMVVLAVGQDGDMELDTLQLTASEPKSENLLRHLEYMDISNSVLTVVNRIQTIVSRDTQTTTTAQTGTFTAWNCDFEEDDSPFCDMEQSMSDDFDWTRGRESTPSFDTGPYRARSGDYYIYIEASGKSDGDEAIINLPRLFSSGKHCVSFAYHMYGFHIRELQLFVQSASGNVGAWNETGRHDSSWKDHTITLNLSHNDQIGFAAVRGEAFSGDIALDNIHVQRGQC